MPAATKTNEQRSADTRGALIETATRLFGDHGYAGVGTELIVKEAKVTRGALYHHFKDKRDLFRAVYEQMEADTMLKIAERLGPSADPWDVALGGSKIFLDLCLDKRLQQISILDAPTVLGTNEQREIADKHAGSLVEATITALIEGGEIRPLPVRPLSRMFMGALIEGGMVIAEAKNKKRARAEVGEVVEALLRGLAVDSTATSKAKEATK